MNAGCVLMAAGASVRFGENKLLYPLLGRNLVSRAVEAAPAALFSRAVAVVSDEKVAQAVAGSGYRCLYNPDAARGQGTTVALGAAAMVGMDAVLFCVADQPYLTRRSVKALLAAWRPERICALSWAGKRGNPVLFPAECLPALAALSPGQTGKTVVAENPGRLLLVEAADPRELFDIDRKEDLENR